MARSTPETELRTEPGGCAPALLRLTWMVFGNLALVVCAQLVAKGENPVVMDVVFFTVAVGLIAVRYVDIAKFEGQTSSGDPATMAHWRRYAATMVLTSTGLWALARLAASRGWL